MKSGTIKVLYKHYQKKGKPQRWESDPIHRDG